MSKISLSKRSKIESRSVVVEGWWVAGGTRQACRTLEVPSFACGVGMLVCVEELWHAGEA